MKQIETLVSDVYETVSKGTVVLDEDVKTFADDLSRIVAARVNKGTTKSEFTLRMSNLAQCTRRQWIEKNSPSSIEPLEPHTYLKFLMGDVWEAVLLFLARVSGHTVEGQQDEINLHGVLGHRDAVIDGVLVDVKSASSASFKKFDEGLTESSDGFGYLTQLGGYLEGSILSGDERVKDKSRFAFLAGDKQLGHITLDVHTRSDRDFRTLVDDKLAALAGDTIPPRPYSDEPDGKSGNRKLGTTCSYCPVKHACWGNLRQFNYSGRPRWLTRVVREPKVTENEPF